MRLDGENLRNDRNFFSPFCDVAGRSGEVCGICFSIVMYWFSTKGGDMTERLCFIQSSEDSIGESSGRDSSDSDESSCSPSSVTLSISSFLTTVPQICSGRTRQRDFQAKNKG